MTYYPKWLSIPSIIMTIYLLGICVYGVSSFMDYVKPPDWRSKYKDQEDVSCCGASDCVQAEIAVLTEQFPFPDEVWIEVSRYKNKMGKWVDHDGPPIRVNAKGVHLSEDQYAWFCHYHNQYNEFEMDEQATRICFTNEEISITQECARCIFLNYGT